MNKNNKTLDTIKSFIISYLSLKILNDAFKPNQIVPSENLLAEKFGCSRLTARNAILVLVHLGVLYTIKGSGHYVSENAIKILLPTLYISKRSEKIINEFINQKEKNKYYKSEYFNDENKKIAIVYWSIGEKIDDNISKSYQDIKDFSEKLISSGIIGVKVIEKVLNKENLTFISQMHYDENNNFLFGCEFWYENLEEISTKTFLKI